ncbi:MAG TPA: NAD(P)-binding protein [Solirubrobacterales bacterium]|nr:NAD(P)-binding protein [Solirubrobacterales bacterium]
MISADYLIVGSGASGLAFADTLVAEDPDAELVLVDRRPGVGGHWLNSYPFVRLHTPSAYYGVNSSRLGEDRIDESGENAGFYERATGAEVREYFAEAASRLTQTGRVRILCEHEHLGLGDDGERVRDLTTGALLEVDVRRKLVDARYLEASIPATHKPPFEIAEDARVVPVNDLPKVAEDGILYTVLGSGKTAVDACIWLLDNDVAPDRIRSIRPRDHWFHHRRHFQALDLVGENMEGISLDAQAGAEATSLEDLFERLEGSGRLVRIDPSATATMYRSTMLSPAELDALRQVEDVVRLGHVRRIEGDRIVMADGETDTGSDVVHVDCTAHGLSGAPPVPVFQEGRIVLQQIRQNSPTFNSALIAFIEAHREDDVEKNRLCPPNPYPSSIGDWPGMSRRTWKVEQRWLREPDLAGWIAESRLNLLKGLPDHAADPAVKASLERFLTYVGPAIERLGELD